MRMARYTYNMTPRRVPKVDGRFRRILTDLPVPESLPILETLTAYEPISMTGQPPVVWDRAEGFQVHDRWGNMWLDWSSGVLVANCGHSREEVKQAIIDQVQKGLLHNYCFPTDIRARLAKKLVEVTPHGLDKAFVLTTGSETTENAIKLARAHGQKVGGKKKIGVVSFTNAFHGRTMAAQLMGGTPRLKEWMGPLGPGFYQVPFPDGFRCEDQTFDLFLNSLKGLGLRGGDICCVITESYQGGGASFAPEQYMRKLDSWCEENEAVLIFDEVQAGFGRTGKLFAFEHYNVVPDLLCCGKGITSSLPLSAVVGRSDIMDLFGPGEMTSTHGGNPVCAAAALASIESIQTQNLVENARDGGAVLHAGLREIKDKYCDVIGALHGRGLVAGVHIVKEGSKDPDSELAFKIVEKSMEKGLLFFSPVGFGGATVKAAPPLTITEEAVKEGCEVLDEAIGEAVGSG